MARSSPATRILIVWIIGLGLMLTPSRSHAQIGGSQKITDGTGSFSVMSHNNSGFYVPGDGEALIKLKGANNRYLVAASQNNGPLKMFSSENTTELISAEPMDAYAIIHFESGKQRKSEFYYGSSFLSASSRFIPLTENMTKIEFIDYNGERRTVHVP